MPQREQLERMLQDDPDDNFVRYALGLALISEGETAPGLERLDEVIQRDPDYVAAYFQKGQALAKSGDAAAAREAVERGIEVARRVGDEHAEMEMRGFLQEIGG